MESRRKERESPPSSYLQLAGLGLQMTVVIAAATWGGWELDQYLNLKFPVFTLLFVFAALVGLIFKLIQAVKDDNS